MAGGDRPERRRRQRRPQGNVSRTRLLDAGIEVFAELSLEELLREIGPRRVVGHLGDVSQGAFYHHFPSQADYLAHLAAHALAPARDEIAPEIAGQLFELAGLPDTDLLGHLDRICTRDFEHQRTAGLRGFEVQLCLWTKRDDPAVGAALRADRERLNQHLAPAFERILERWGREFRPPFTVTSATATFAALLEGLVRHHAIDPEAVAPELFAKTVQALLPTMTRPIGDDADLDEAVAPIARFARGPRTGPVDPDARRRLLDTALARADAGAFADATLEELAADAGAPVEVLYQEFQGKPGLAAAAFARHLPLLERPLRAELEEERAPLDIIRAHLERLAEISARHRGLTAALLDAFQTARVRNGRTIGANDPRAIVPLPEIVEPAVRAGQEQGVVEGGLDAFEVAEALTDLLLLRAVTHPDEPAERMAEVVGRIGLFGIARPA